MAHGLNTAGMPAIPAYNNHREIKMVAATWSIELLCRCPGCGEYVDLLDYTDFWDCRRLELGEHDTEDSKGVDVVCPECEHEFEVDLKY